MYRLNEKELKKISGKGFSMGWGLFVGGIVTFVLGFIDGYVRPLSCH